MTDSARTGIEQRFLELYPPPLSCIVCGQTGQVAIMHSPSGCWVCMKCREAVRQFAGVRQQAAREIAQRLRGRAKEYTGLGWGETSAVVLELEARAYEIERDYGVQP